MASAVPPVKNAIYSFEVSLISQADTDIFQTSVTLAAGDVQVSKDGGAFSNITSLPTEIGTSGVLTVSLSAPEMNADRVAVLFNDAAGNEWCDLLVIIHTAAQTMDTIDSNVDSILTDTGTDGVVVSSHTTAAKAEIQAEAEDALEAYDLDHFIQVTAGSEEPTDGSYLDQIMHKNASQTFSAGTDSLEAIRDTMASSTVTTVASVSGDDITVVPYTTWEFTVDGLADLSDALASGVFFTVKQNHTDADSAAILQVQEGVGLTYLNGATASDASKATLTVAAGEDEITVHVNASQTGLAEQRNLVWDIKKVITASEDADQMATGDFHISDEAVTRALTVS